MAFAGRVNDSIFIGQRYYVILIVVFIIYFNEIFKFKIKYLNILIVIAILVWPTTFIKRFANKFDEANNNFRVLINGKFRDFN